MGYLLEASNHLEKAVAQATGIDARELRLLLSALKQSDQEIEAVKLALKSLAKKAGLAERDLSGPSQSLPTAKRLLF